MQVEFQQFLFAWNVLLLAAIDNGGTILLYWVNSIYLNGIRKRLWMQLTCSEAIKVYSFKQYKLFCWALLWTRWLNISFSYKNHFVELVQLSRVFILLQVEKNRWLIQLLRDGIDRNLQFVAQIEWSKLEVVSRDVFVSKCTEERFLMNLSFLKLILESFIQFYVINYSKKLQKKWSTQLTRLSR